eukprot:122611-Rhodomonas_salina.4
MPLTSGLRTPEASCAELNWNLEQEPRTAEVLEVIRLPEARTWSPTWPSRAPCSGGCGLAR